MGPGEQSRLSSRAHPKGQGTNGNSGRPGRYALGSAESRAAARALLNSKRVAQFEGILVRLVSNERDRSGRECTCPMPEAGKFALCRCFE